jgi:nicotinamidase-related amidase
MGLEEYLKYVGVTQVVIAGVATSIGVESTARPHTSKSST